MVHLAAPAPALRTAAQVRVVARSPRVAFVDLARALAVIFMLYGHAIDALLDPRYRTGAWFDLWQFQRGLTAALFLLLAGCAFSLATTSRWSSYLAPSPALGRRIRRFAFYVALGYGLHFPVGSVFALAGATEAQWRALLAVDVLQLIGTTFILVHLLLLVARSQAAFVLATGATALAIVAATPSVWRVEWTAHLPLGAASFLSPATGSLFPLFPWAGYVLLGTVIGQVYGRWQAGRLTSFANWVLLGPGVILFVCGRAIRPYQVQMFGADAFSYVPSEVMIRTGACLLIVGTIAHVSRVIRRVPGVISAVAQETLVIYFVHLCLVYGSIWNPGLRWLFGATLTPLPMAAVVGALILSMGLLAWGWHRLKDRAPDGARWVARVVVALLVLRLI